MTKSGNPRRGRPDWSKIQTAGRDAIMRRDYPSGVDSHEIIRRLNEIPGKTVRMPKTLVVYAGALKVRRPFEFGPLKSADSRRANSAKKRKIAGLSEPVVDNSPLPPLTIDIDQFFGGSQALEEPDAEPIDICSAVEWGRRNGVTEPFTLKEINKTRMKFQLPTFVVSGSHTVGLRKSPKKTR